MTLDAIGIISKDINKTLHFYSLLGIDLRPNGSDEHLEAVTKSGMRLMVDSVQLIQKINPNWTPSKGSNIVLCFKQESAKDVDYIYQKMVEENGFSSVKSPWDAFWGQRYCSILDPDGNQIDLFSDL